MGADILVVDDEQAIADLVEVYLKNEGYIVHKFYNGKEAIRSMESKQIDLAILDVMLPDIDGFDLCRKIREKHNFPVIMLTAKEEEVNKITGLTLGADDYVTKPFHPLELVARVKAQLRRFTQYNASKLESQESILSFSGLTLNQDTHECTLNGKPLSLTPTEFSILGVLISNRGHVVSSEKLFRDVWGEKCYSNSNNTVMVHIRHLREKMSDSVEHPKYIKTVWGSAIKLKSKLNTPVKILLIVAVSIVSNIGIMFVLDNGITDRFFANWIYNNFIQESEHTYQGISGTFVDTQFNWLALKKFICIASVIVVAIIALLSCLIYYNSAKKKSRQVMNIVSDAMQQSLLQDQNLPALPQEYDEFKIQLMQLKESERCSRQLAQTEMQRKNDLITYLAHDLKTPLASVIGYLCLLNEAPDMPEKQKEEYTDIALQKAYRLEELINEFLILPASICSLLC